MDPIQIFTDVLRSKAKARQRISYADLSDLLKGHGLQIGCSDKKMWDCLRAVSNNEHGAGRGMLSIVVVQGESGGVGTGYPGKGFFSQAKSLGYEFTDRIAFFNEHIEFVYNCNR